MSSPAVEMALTPTLSSVVMWISMSMDSHCLLLSSVRGAFLEEIRTFFWSFFTDSRLGDATTDVVVSPKPVSCVVAEENSFRGNLEVSLMPNCRLLFSARSRIFWKPQ